ncbi:MAG TPA: M48 family metallopeptidase [Gemmataceae bacterium]|jgi:Zn-dependent protease with chaperone function
MAVDFFQQQDTARRKTALLVVYFASAVLTLVVLIYLLCVVLFHLPPSDAEPSAPPWWWDPQLLLIVVVGVVAVVGGGSLIKTVELAAGGKTVALMLGGRLVPNNSNEPAQRRLLNVVEEMAIASGVPAPPVYLLPHETGINAFAAGHAPDDAVVAVSRGCLEYLTRDELQGVVAHEFSHILNGDMRLNIRLLGLIFGILALSLIGRILMASAARGSSSRGGKGSGRSDLLLLGLGLYVLGLAGAFFGWLIQAAVSRQREFLADASAVQFTRNPDGIGGALKKIGGLAEGATIANPRAQEVSHMFFADAFTHRLSNLFATHPPLAERIKRLDPHFDGKYPVVRPLPAGPEEPKAPRGERRLPIVGGRLGAAALAGASAEAEVAASRVGTVTPSEVHYAEAMHADIPEPLRSAAQEPFAARALIYALLLDSREPIRAAQLAQLQREAEPRDYEQTLRLVEAVRRLPDADRLPLVDLAIPALRQMSPRQHQVFRAQIEGLIYADQQVSIFEYALHCVLKRHLDADFQRVRPRTRYGSAIKLAPQVATVLSRLAWEGQPEEEAARTAFEAGMRCYLGGDLGPYRLLPPAQCPLAAFDAALRTLAEATPDIKRRVVVSGATCILADRQVTVREGELLRAISATLGCPMPPLYIEEKPAGEL